MGKKNRFLACAAVSLLSLALLTMMTISMGMMYWHMTLKSALTQLKVDREHFRSRLVVLDSGSRGVRYLVDELDPAKGREWMISVTHELTYLVFALEETGHFELLPVRRIPRVLTDDSPEEITQKCNVIREWWHENSMDDPPSWQFWSGRKR